MALLNFFFDYGMALTFGNTYSTCARRLKRYLLCKPCRSKVRKRIRKSKEDKWNKMEEE